MKTKNNKSGIFAVLCFFLFVGLASAQSTGNAGADKINDEINALVQPVAQVAAVCCGLLWIWIGAIFAKRKILSIITDARSSGSWGSPPETHVGRNLRTRAEKATRRAKAARGR